MKKYVILIAFMCTIHFFTCYGMQTMVATLEIISTDMVERLPAAAVVDQVSYTNGGLVITYPASMFTQPPTISLAVQAPSHVSSLTYTAEISNNSATSATIMVYKDQSGVISEAATGEVIVHFVAIGT